VIVCSPQLGIIPGSGLGGAVFDYQILAHLARRGVNLRIITPRQLPCEPIPGAAVEFVSVPKGRYANWAFGQAVGRLYQRENFDLLRVFSPRYVGLAAWVFHTRYPAVPVVVNHLHLEPNPIDRWLTWLCVRHADSLIAISEFSKRQLVGALGARPERIKVIYPGVSDSYVASPVDLAFLPSLGMAGKKIVLYLGGLISRKNLPFLLECFSLVVQKIPQACLVLIGEGDARQQLERKVEQLGLGAVVRLPGFATEAEKLRWLNACDVFVSPARLEGFGMNVAEAMACRKPVVVSGAGSLPEVVVDGETGLVAPLDDLEGFGMALIRLLSDEPLRLQMGAAGERRVRTLFRWERAASQVEEVYHQAIAAKRNVTLRG
jgi:glycosyltransferase involved in cell wall biosynthesis